MLYDADQLQEQAKKMEEENKKMIEDQTEKLAGEVASLREVLENRFFRKGSGNETTKCTTFGCLSWLSNTHSPWDFCWMEALCLFGTPGSTKMSCSRFAMQGTPSTVTLYTTPYAPDPFFSPVQSPYTFFKAYEASWPDAIVEIRARTSTQQIFHRL